ncbi:Orotate phosphoribosyltransferase [Candidatus Tiddalikarchaeum anstoanum]|nr:Orotate phosphoribosyltransferase [Candidatus Tiddalikarchaeum anstoanum]
MEKFNQNEFNDFIITKGIIGIKDKPFKLKSGRESYFYFNWRNVAEDVYNMEMFTDYIIQFVNDKGLQPRCFYGIPAGATKAAIITQYKWAMGQLDFCEGAYPLPLGREVPKEHGDPKDKFFVGEPKGDVVILEDVTTTGASLIKGVDQLLESKLKILAAIGFTNRNEKDARGKSVEESLKEKNVAYYAMSNALETLPKYVNGLKEKPKEEVLRNIEDEFKQFGTQEINW